MLTFFSCQSIIVFKLPCNLDSRDKTSDLSTFGGSIYTCLTRTRRTRQQTRRKCCCMSMKNQIRKRMEKPKERGANYVLREARKGEGQFSSSLASIHWLASSKQKCHAFPQSFCLCHFSTTQNSLSNHNF